MPFKLTLRVRMEPPTRRPERKHSRLEAVSAKTLRQQRMAQPGRPVETARQDVSQERLQEEVSEVSTSDSPKPEVRPTLPRAHRHAHGARRLLDRNSRSGMAMLAVAEMCVSFTTSTGSALMMMSGISTLQTASATTHWLAQR